MSYWTVAQLQPQRERLAVHCLGLSGFETYLPKLRERRVVRGRKVDVNPPLFPGYLFVLVELQWHAARWAPGVITLILDGFGPAKVSDALIEEIRGRERKGLIELAPRLQHGDRVGITGGPFKATWQSTPACLGTSG
jgi:transcriptional antiterminator RfaH